MLETDSKQRKILSVYDPFNCRVGESWTVDHIETLREQGVVDIAELFIPETQLSTFEQYTHEQWVQERDTWHKHDALFKQVVSKRMQGDPNDA